MNAPHTRRPGRLAATLVLLLAAAAAMAAPDTAGRPGALEVVRLTPEGEDVPPGQQLVLQFNQDVVPVGDMRRDAATLPVTVTPSLACEWRWINSSALACQLGERDALRPATRYTVQVRPGLAAISGATMARPWQASFVTQRPDVRRADLVFWLTPQQPIVRVMFSTPVTKSSVLRALSFTAGTQATPFDLYADDMKRNFPDWMEYLGITADQPQHVDDGYMPLGNDEARRIWLLVPKHDLPADTSVHLALAPGLVTPLGPEPGAQSRTAVAFDTFPAFRFLGIRCTPNEPDPSNTEGEDINVERLAAGNAPGCDPLAPVTLRFSSPVVASQVKTNVAFAPRLDGGRSDYDPWENVEDYTRRDNPHRRGAEYTIWLPELLKAAQTYRISIGTGLRDEFGRAPATPVTVDFRTTHRDPRLVIDYRDAVLEKGVDSQAAGYSTNISRLHYRGTRRDAKFGSSPVQVDQPMANIQDISYKFALLVREILRGESGITWFCVESTPSAVQRWHGGNCVFAQVTPYQVHAKLGHYSSLVWVTDLATGAPVPGARVEVMLGRRDALDAAPPVGPVARTQAVVTNAQGIAELPGIETLDPGLDFLGWHWGEDAKTLFVRVAKDGTAGSDIAMLPLDNAFQAYPGNGIWADLQKKGQHSHAWGYTAQGTYRAGETVDAKFYVRDQSNRRWVAPAKRDGYTLRVVDPTGTAVHSVDNIALDGFGAHAFQFRLAPNAVAGWHEVQLRRADGTEWQALRFLVSDFTPASFRTEGVLAGDLFGPGDELKVTTRATLYSGGAFTGANARVSARIEGRDYAPGTTVTRGYSFGSWDQRGRGEQSLGEQQGKVDGNGELGSRFNLEDNGIYYGRLLVESAVMDERGKYVSSLSSALYVSRDRFVGIKARDWLQQANRDAVFDLVVADPRGQLVAGTDIEVTLEKRVIRTARVQGPGDAFLLRNTGDWEATGNCRVQSRADGSVACTLKMGEPGSYRVLAKVLDTKGREYVSEEGVWVVGAGWVNWASDNDGSLEIVPESDKVKVGATARYLVKNPYPGARALITVERYGVLEKRSQVFTDSTAVVEVPVTRDMAPGFYLSVVVASPRVAKPIEGEVDLGKPAFRMGYVKTEVEAPDKRIGVTLKPAREEYRPRDEVVAKLKATLPAGSAPQPLSVAVVAIDEAVLALNAKGARYYDPVAGFNRLDALDVGNWNLVTRLIGRQKIEKKGANPGGDGGKSDGATLRNDFRYVALWQGELKLDAKGEAEIRFKAPDNLTGWRLLAIAVTPDDLFGLGETTIRVNRPTEIRPAMPNQLTEGDRFIARFTVMNRTARARTLDVRIDGSGATMMPLATKLALAAYEQKVVELPVTTTAAGNVSFRASAGDASDRDALAHSVPVKARRIREVAANYASTVDPQAIDAVAIPAAIYPESSELSVTLAPTVLGNLDGAYRYVTQYPYLCWEQRLSKALMYASTKPLKPWLKEADLPKDPDALVRDMLASAPGFQAPNGGMTYWQPNDGYVSPYLSAYTALGFRWLARGGYAVPKETETRLHDYLRQLLRTDTLPSFYDAGMSSSVRAVALAALADAGAINKDEVLRYASHLPRMSLLGKSHYLQALAATGAPVAEIQRTTDAILAMGNQSGGKFQLLERLDDGYSQLLATPLRDNCAALSALLRVGNVQGVRGRVADIPFRLVRTITQARGNRDHFENTQENVFCANALYAYARVYEPEQPAMTVKVRYEVNAADGGNASAPGAPAIAPRTLGEVRFASVKDAQQLLRMPVTAADPGRSGRVVIDRAGNGRLYYSTRLAFAPKDEIAQSANNGIGIVREYSVKRGGQWALLKNGERLARGDVVRVDLFVQTPGARHYVVVDDPVPGLLEPVNTALATESTFDDKAAAFDGDAHSYWYSNRDGWETFGRYGYSFYHREMKHDAVRFYADLLPAGRYHLSYAAQVIATGEFAAQPAYAGEMYDIDVFGRGLPVRLSAGESGADAR